jgi:DNA-binding transcriptional ArsR family regulator
MDETCGQSLFLKIFGSEPVIKILDFLLDNDVFDYSKTEIAEGAAISRTTLFTAWPKLEEAGLVIPTREVGRAKMFKLNTENPIVKKLFELDEAASDYYAPASGRALVEEEAGDKSAALIYS